MNVIRMLSKILIAKMCVIESLVMAETVDLSIQYTAPSGQSVFVTAPHPLFGNGDKTKAIKLSPHDNNQWNLLAELPANTNLTFTYYLRADSPSHIPNHTNGKRVHTAVKATKPVTMEPQRITVTSPANALASEIRITSRHGFYTTIALARATVNGETRFVGTVDAVHRANGHDMEVFVDGTAALTNSVPIRCHAAPLFYEGGQAYHYDPKGPLSAPQRLSFTFTPAGFRPRRVSVLLPRGYVQNTTKRYPVVYAEDGQHAFSHSGSPSSWEIDMTSETMISRGELPEVIVIAIDNTSDRSAEYTPEYTSFQGIPGRGGAYVTAIRDGLLPIVNRNYRTETDAAKTLHVGRSLGGLLGYHIARNHEKTWGSVIAMSTVFSVGLADNVMFADLPLDQWGRLYIDCGTAGKSDDDYAGNVTVRDRLIQNGHVFGPKFFYTVGNGQGHDEDAWRSRYPESMRWWAGPLLDEMGSD